MSTRLERNEHAMAGMLAIFGELQGTPYTELAWALARLRQAEKALAAVPPCSRCKGTGTVPLDTYDHDCANETAPCRCSQHHAEVREALAAIREDG